jgi:hypothetical protein
MGKPVSRRSHMSSEKVRRARRIYSAAAFSNFVFTIPAFIAYKRYIDAFLPERPNYRFLVWIWSGMAFLWGVSFVEIARDPEHAYPLLKYSWLEKSVTSASVIKAFADGELPGRVVAGVVVSDVMWIPAFMWAHAGLARELRATSEGRADAQNR